MFLFFSFFFLQPQFSTFLNQKKTHIIRTFYPNNKLFKIKYIINYKYFVNYVPVNLYILQTTTYTYGWLNEMKKKTPTTTTTKV